MPWFQAGKEGRGEATSMGVNYSRPKDYKGAKLSNKEDQGVVKPPETGVTLEDYEKLSKLRDRSAGRRGAVGWTGRGAAETMRPAGQPSFGKEVRMLEKVISL